MIFDCLPDGWELTNIGNVGEIVTGNTPSTKNKEFYDGGKIPFVKPADLDKDDIIFESIDTVTQLGASKGRLLPSGSIVISCIGNLGKSAILGKESITNQQINAIIPYAQIIDNKYIFYWSKIIRNWMELNASATTVTILNKSRFSEAPIPLPPLNEQKRIVNKIEKLQDKRAKVKAELEAIARLIPQFRQSVLAAAFRGDLTDNWRKNNPDVESAELLLEKIKFERRQKWEANELEKMKAQGKTPVNDHWKMKYQEPETVIDVDDLPDIPDSWMWVKFDFLIQESQNGCSKRKSSEGKPTPVLRLADITNNQINNDEPREILLNQNDIKKYKLYKNDLLCIRVNGSQDLVGRIICIKDNLEWAFCDHFIRFRLITLVNIIFISNLFNNVICRQYIENNRVSSAGQNTVSQTTIGNLPIPLAPLEEQKEIVRKIETAFNFADRIETEIKTALEELENLNQSILAKAFRGELVPQIPTDEPASMLLAKIKQMQGKLNLKRAAVK